MRFLPICISVLLLAAGAGCSAYLLERLRSSHISLAILGAVLTLVLLAYFATGRQEKGAWVRFGLYGAAMMICAASIWMEIVRPVLEASSFPGFVDRLTRLSGYELALIAVPPPGFAISFMLWFEVLIDSLKHLSRAITAASGPSPISTAGRSCSAEGFCAASPNARASCSASGARAATPS